jgi:hypothetical protein
MKNMKYHVLFTARSLALFVFHARGARVVEAITPMREPPHVLFTTVRT